MQKQNTLSAVVHRAKLGRSAESPGAFWVLMQSYLQFLKTALKKQKHSSNLGPVRQSARFSLSEGARETHKQPTAQTRTYYDTHGVRISQGLINTLSQPNCLVLRSPASFLLQRVCKSLVDGRRRGY